MKNGIEWALVSTTWTLVFVYLLYLSTKTHHQNFKRTRNTIQTLDAEEMYYFFVSNNIKQFTTNQLQNIYSLSKLNRKDTGFTWNTKRTLWRESPIYLLKNLLQNESCSIKTYIKAWYHVWYDLRGLLGSKLSLMGDAHLCVHSGCRIKSEGKDRVSTLLRVL